MFKGGFLIRNRNYMQLSLGSKSPVKKSSILMVPYRFKKERKRLNINKQCWETDPGSGAFLTPGSEIRYPGCVKNQAPGSGMNNPDHLSESLETFFWAKNTFMRIRNRDPGGKNSDPGQTSRICNSENKGILKVCWSMKSCSVL